MRYHRKLQLLKSLSKKMCRIRLRGLHLRQQKASSSQSKSTSCRSETTNEYSNQHYSSKAQALQQQEDASFQQFRSFNYRDTDPQEIVEQFLIHNSQPSQIFFMSRKQKRRYFDKINKIFKEKLEKTPQRICKTKKILNFKSRFEVRPFNEYHQVVTISKTKTIYEKYQHHLHFS